MPTIPRSREEAEKRKREHEERIDFTIRAPFIAEYQDREKEMRDAVQVVLDGANSHGRSTKTWIQPLRKEESEQNRIKNFSGKGKVAFFDAKKRTDNLPMI